MNYRGSPGRQATVRRSVRHSNGLGKGAFLGDRTVEQHILIDMNVKNGTTYATLALVASAFWWTAVVAQPTVTVFQPDFEDGYDAAVYSCIPCGFASANYGNYVGLHAIAWTNSGAQSDVRSLLRFQLELLPEGAEIIDARLSLYHDNESNELQHSSLSGPNTALLRRVIEPWEEQTVIWATQPSTTSADEVVIPATTSPTQDVLDVDVTQLVIAMIENGNFGFMLRLQDESYYRRMVFASSDHPNRDLHPKLVVTHQGGVGIASNALSLRPLYPNPTDGPITLHVDRPGIPIEVLDGLGQVVRVFTPSTPGRLDLDLGDLSAGHYTIRSWENGMSNYQRLVLQ